MDLGYWKLDGDVVDYSRWSNDGVANGVLFDERPLLPGGTSSAWFDGVSTITIPHNSTLDLMNNDFGIEFFINRQNDNFTLLDKGAYVLSYNAGINLSLTGENAATFNFVSDDVIPVDKRVFVILSYRAATGDIELFIDGELVDRYSGTPVGPISSVSGLTMGSGFIGSLDHVRISMGGPTLSDVRARFNLAKTNVDYEGFVTYGVPQLFVPMGARVHDTVGLGNDLTWSAEPVSDTEIMYGVSGSSVINTETATFPAPATPFSVSIWARFHNGVDILSFGDTTVTMTGDRVVATANAVSVQSPLMRDDQLVMIGVVFDTDVTLQANKNRYTLAQPPGTSPNISFFGGATQTRVAALEVADFILQESDFLRRYDIGFRGKSLVIKDAGDATPTITDETLVLDFEWTNHSVKR